MKSNNTVLYGGLAVLAVVGIMSVSGKPKKTEMIGAENFNDTSPGTSTPSTPKPKTINKALVLKKGSKGDEVKELQKLLNVTADGIFGAGTEKALLDRKGVKQISLNAFASTPDKNNNPYKAGDKIMSNNIKGCQTYKSEKKADGFYYTNWDKDELIAYGKEVGTIKSMNENKSVYSVNVSTFLGSKVIFVNAIDVKKY